jgi:hypothetical protein
MKTASRDPYDAWLHASLDHQGLGGCVRTTLQVEKEHVRYLSGQFLLGGMREMQPALTEAGEKSPANKSPEVAIVLTLLGDLCYLPFGIAFSQGWASPAAIPLQFLVLLVSTVGVLGCVIMMGVRPKLHVAWGVSVLIFAMLAIVVLWNGLVIFFLSSPLLGVAWYAPAGLVIVGGILAIFWKASSEP